MTRGSDSSGRTTRVAGPGPPTTAAAIGATGTVAEMSADPDDTRDPLLPPGLTPVQERTFALLRRRGEPVVFEPGFVEEIQTIATEALTGFAERLAAGRDDRPFGPDETVLFISKHRLAAILGCEVQALADDEFAWNVAIAGGQIAHRAIELGLNWRGESEPHRLVDEALARVADEDSSLGDWLERRGEADRADLRSDAIERVTTFMECFPPIDQRSRPMTEARLRWPVSGPIVLSGKVDLVIGRPVGAESRKVIIDLKTGRPRPQHRDDLRFYALLETLRTSVPPRKLVSYYLDAADAEAEDVTEGVLRAALRRTLDGIDALVSLHRKERVAVKRPGGPCHWCPLAEDCDEGRAWLERRDDDW